MSNREDRAWRDYSERFRRDVLPKLMESAMMVSIGSDEGIFDVRQATELGAALLMDKPILLVIPRGRTVSSRLRRAADDVLDDWGGADDPQAVDQLMDALERMQRFQER